LDLKDKALTCVVLCIHIRQRGPRVPVNRKASTRYGLYSSQCIEVFIDCGSRELLKHCYFARAIVLLCFFIKIKIALFLCYFLWYPLKVNKKTHENCKGNVLKNLRLFSFENSQNNYKRKWNLFCRNNCVFITLLKALLFKHKVNFCFPTDVLIISFGLTL